jgi:lysophospholipase L1-like esterase
MTATASSSIRPFATARYEHPPKVIAMGDSLVYGYGDPVGGGWVERLRRVWMEAQGPVLYNLGIRGDRVAQVAERLEQEFRYRGEIRNQVPDQLILSVGVNDSPRLGRPEGRNVTDLACFTDQVAALLETAQQLCPVVVVGMVPVNEATMPFFDCFYFNQADQYRYKEVMQQACRERQIPYLDIFERWLERGPAWVEAHLMEDGLHPNVAGYKALLDEVLHWLPPVKSLTSSARLQRLH